MWHNVIVGFAAIDLLGTVAFVIWWIVKGGPEKKDQ
jgi:hypothetical protein